MMFRQHGWRLIVISALLGSNPSISQEAAKTNQYWWPKNLNLSPLRYPNSSSNPNDKNFNYAEAFRQLDLNAVIGDLKQLMVNSQDWWPADYGTYAPFFIRMTWHSAGTYRISDGRGGAEGGMQRFAPLNSWPDNTNLDKARRLLWPIKQKYGNQISWSDLMVLAGNVALESMGFQTIGFAGGRIDSWEPEAVNWGEESEWLASQRHHAGKLDQPYAATQMGLIYVNPEGPNGQPDPLAAAKDIRVTFSRMAMNDEETVALIAGGHAFGKAHGAAKVNTYLGPAPEAAPIEQQGLGWKNTYQSGKGPDTITSGLEGAWTSTPNRWSNDYLENLFHFNWVKTESPAGAVQWKPDDMNAKILVPDAYDKQKRHAPMMFTTDLALKYDPSYRKISERFLKDPKALEQAFAKAWFKLTHRDMGPRSRYLGSLVPQEIFIWQDPLPPQQGELITKQDEMNLKAKILESGLTIPELVQTAWASASVFRGTDMRGGANGARLMLLPQKEWAVNAPQKLNSILIKLQNIQKTFNQSNPGKPVSMADLIVLAGNAAVENSAEKAGYHLDLAFFPGRTDATQAMTDIKSFAVLEPKADAFRNYYVKENASSPEQMLIEKASYLNLSIPEMTVLIGGMRVLDTNYDHSVKGVFTHHPGQLSNDFFVNLLDNQLIWKKSEQNNGVYEGRDRRTGRLIWQATGVDLIFGANSELRAIAEFYAEKDAKRKFIQDFGRAWTKVMNLDRFDLK